MKIKNFIILLFAISFLTFIACEKVDVTNKSVNSTQSPKVLNNPSGFGSISGTPYCAPYNLPSAIQIIGELQSSSFKTFFDKENQDPADFIINPKTTFIPIGSGSLVQVYMKLYNKSSVKQKLIIPGGLIVCPEDTLSQTGVIVQNDTLIIDPNDTTGVLLKAYCTNLHKHTPYNTKFKIIGTTLHEDMYKMVGILKNKQKLQTGSKVQSIIWNITDHGGLTDDDIIYLNNLP